MPTRPDPANMALDLFNESGLDGLVEARRLAEDCRREGDAAGVQYWNSVACRIRALPAQEGGEGAPAAQGFAWRLMQRIEHCRHRAAQCRDRAAKGSEAFREEMLEAERQWLELAHYAEILAEPPAPARAKP